MMRPRTQQAFWFLVELVLLCWGHYSRKKKQTKNQTRVVVFDASSKNQPTNQTNQPTHNSNTQTHTHNSSTYKQNKQQKQQGNTTKNTKTTHLRVHG